MNSDSPKANELRGSHSDMPIPPNIDLDKLLTYLLSDATCRSLTAGRMGFRPTKFALMNHLTGRLVRRRRGCDVGVNSQVTVTSRSASLHRQGRNQTDLYGGDLAVSVLILPTTSSQKRHFFNLVKKGSNFEFVLERRQLLDSQKTQYSRDRSFVLYADLQRTGIKIASSSDCLPASSMDAKRQSSFLFSGMSGLCPAVHLLVFVRIDASE